jgi:hypothetical protein
MCNISLHPTLCFFIIGWCGLFIECQSQITVDPYSIKIACDVDGLSELPLLTATSASGPVTTELKEDVFSGGCLGTLVRTFNFTDAAGNLASAQQFVNITDNQPPMLFGEARDISTTSEMIPEPAQFASRDNSGKEYPVLFTEKREGKIIRRIWTCTDDCGNTTEKLQVITLE